MEVAKKRNNIPYNIQNWKFVSEKSQKVRIEPRKLWHEFKVVQSGNMQLSSQSLILK